MIRATFGCEFVRVFPIVLLALTACAPALRAARPNVVMIMTDDQGYGDFGATGNRVIETPHIDALARAGATLANFYVSPVCSPTRACLMTGRYNYRTRVVDTYIGRSMMDSEEVTLAEALHGAGYATGIFGKWHLGDCYPMRAFDQGFAESLVIRGGGLAQPSDARGNNRRYTDPILFHNGEAVLTKGFCTDVYFDAALRFIEQSHNGGRPFFVYLPTNAPHGPVHDVPPKWLEHYQQRRNELADQVVTTGDRPPREAEIETLARVAAMISNIDENVGRLMQRLDDLHLTDNTILVFLIDNGPDTPRDVGPFRGMKKEVYEGGIRSPCWIRWPARLRPGAQVDAPAAHIDVMPTLLAACDVPPPKGVQLDGVNLLGLLREEITTLPERPIVIQSHRGDVPVRHHNFMIRLGRWKLLHSSGFDSEQFEGNLKLELYDLESDPGERNNLVAEHPDLVADLLRRYEEWFDDVSHTRPDNYAPPRIHIGSTREPTTTLTRQDWRGAKWERDAVGTWRLFAEKAGAYTVRVFFDGFETPAILELKLADSALTAPIDAGATEHVFNGVSLATGEIDLTAVLASGDVRRGVHQVELIAD